MTTAQRVFDLAMAIIDEVDANGRTDHADTAEYKARTLLILNALRGELYPYSDTYDADEEGRPVAPVIKAFDTPVGLDDYLCQTVLPWGLAAILLMDENPSTAGFCQQKYEELKETAKRGVPRSFEDIADVYGHNGEYDEFGRW